MNAKYITENGLKYCIAIYNGGDKWWYHNGKLHREGGPALECSNGDKSWYHNGQLHREDGPAIEMTNGDKFWYIYGKYIFSEKQFFRLINLKALL